MFSKKTVFFLGAGAGHDYNMPLGKGLKDSIASKLKADPDELWPTLVNPLGLASHENAHSYREIKQLIASNMDKAESIDNFLHTHSENPTLVTVGKVAIAACILDAERYSNMMPVVPRETDAYIFSFRSETENWLSRFCTMAFTGLVASDAHTAFNNVTIVTFNYDRCIEQYIVGHIESYLGISERAAQDIVSSLNIIHVYGKVGKLPWQSGPEPDIPFGKKPAPEQLLVVSQGIRTFTERVEEDDTQQRIEAKLAEAEIVVFSGFSFGSSNWEFLQNSTPGPRKMAIAGMMGISSPNQVNIQNRLTSYLHPAADVYIEPYDGGCLELLYDYSSYFE
ncbi:hypothetical protein [Agrobacterium sp. P15N1-A]|uniref:hypothetical protein n=1 Tax=Agrobacterium sp. P15N1-A TaxID=3342820 RepID=UPI0037D311F7